jgi:hypothetical protein
MTYMNNNNNNNNRPRLIAAAGTIFTLVVIMVASSLAITTPVAAIPTTSNITATTPSSPSGIELSAQPVYQQHLRVVSQNPINETHMSIAFSGNGTLTLPNATQTINTTVNGSALISFMTLSVQGKETIRTQDGSDTATATIYEIDQQPASSGEGKGIVIAVVNTNSTSSTLAPLNGMIVAGIDDILTTTGESDITLWRWESGISSNSGVAAPPPGANTTSTQGTPTTSSSSNNNTTTATNEASS